MDNIGIRIKNRREELHLTQDELAFRLGYASRSSVAKVENSVEITMKKAKKYAKALNTTIPELMGWKDETVIETATLDVALTNMDIKIKEYSLKLAELPKEKQELVMQMIDNLL